jgi:hypothetical protein
MYRLASAVLGLLVAIAEACTRPLEESTCVSACRMSFQRVTFVDGDAHASFYGKPCRSRLNMQSLYICLDVYCQEYNLDKLNATCVAEYGEGVLPHTILEDLGEDDIAAVRRFNEKTFNFGARVGELLLVDEDSFGRWLDTIVRWKGGLRLGGSVSC